MTAGSDLTSLPTSSSTARGDSAQHQGKICSELVSDSDIYGSHGRAQKHLRQDTSGKAGTTAFDTDDPLQVLKMRLCREGGKPSQIRDPERDLLKLVESPEFATPSMGKQQSSVCMDQKPEERGTNEEKYNVYRIVKRREQRSKGVEYLVEWEDYPDPRDFTWEPAQKLEEDVPAFVTAFKRT
jgi:hypothetical protein